MNYRNQTGHDPYSVLLWICILGGVAILMFITLPVSAEVCVDCHDDMAESIKNTTHDFSKVECSNCHFSDVHIEDPSKTNITTPNLESDGNLILECTVCHKPHLQKDQVGFDLHQAQGLNCLNCHKIHRPEFNLLLDQSGEFCTDCHSNVARQFEKRSAHPLEDDVLTCWSCHDFVGDEPNLSNGLSISCLNCHPEKSGPYTYEHEPTSTFTTEGDGCISCHSPHGSSNQYLLKQMDNGLCRQCHVIPRHNTAHNGAFAGANCIDCHSDIHGSYENRNLLNTSIGLIFGDGPEGCYCHTVGN